MLAYQTPINNLQRLLQNDNRKNFKIIFNIKNNEQINDDFLIQKEKQIIINTTINKARVISKAINDEYINNPQINQFVFNLENKKYKYSELIIILQAIMKCDTNEMQISEDKLNVYYQILSILDNENQEHGNGKKGNNDIIECEYLYNNMFNGIISYLKQITYDIVDGNNDHLRITAPVNNSQWPLSNLLLYDDKDIDKCYINWKYTLTIEDAWIEFDFVKRKINMTSYAIRAIYNNKNVFHPKAWKFMGSNDHTKWEMIDMKENNDEINEPRKCSHFECTNKNGFYRYIKYIQIENWTNFSYQYSYQNQEALKYYIGMSSIEFFGSITSTINE